MKKLFKLMVAAVTAWPLLVLGSGAAHLDHAKVNVNDKESLQRGAKYYVNYCIGCHGLSYLRYNRMGKDIGLTDDEVKANLMFTAEKVGEPMSTAMTKSQGVAWLGMPPPDLSVNARARGADWIYTYLRSFYLDESRPFGVNNRIFPGAAMPHVLWELQGTQKAVMHENESGVKAIEKLELVKPGKMSAEEFDKVALDITNFMVYAAEPAQLKRQQIGPWVLLYFVIFTIVAYLLKREYWKDVK